MNAVALVVATTTDSHTHTPLWEAIVILAIVGLFGLALAGIAAMRVLIWFSGRMGPSGSTRFRGLVTSLLIRLRPEAIHRPDPKLDVHAIDRGLAVIRDRDPLFDGEAVLGAARRGGFLTFVLRMGGDSDAIANFVTDKFWGSALGRQLANATGVQLFGAAAQSSAIRKQAAAAGGPGADAPVRSGGGVYPLDFSVREARIVAVEPGQDGLDRVTIRIGWMGSSAATGVYARALAQENHLEMHGDVVRRHLRGWYDLEFIRSAGEKTEPVVGGWRCGQCGGPYDSEFDFACPFCGAERSVPEGEWQLNAGWLVACPANA